MSLRKMSVMLGAMVATLATASPSIAGPARKITVSVQNMASGQSVAVSALTFAFHSGTFDPFNTGSAANNAIVPVAELGDGVAWRAAFSAGDPGAVVGHTTNVLTPGQADSAISWVNDAGVNSYFSFGAMVVPSNDHFIGNDNPLAFHLFDNAGNLLIHNITLTASDIWDAGSELFDPSKAAFVAGADATQRSPENGVIRHDFAEYNQFDGLNTAAGYTFKNGLSANTAIYRIHFDVAAVPEPASWALMLAGFGLVGGTLRRSRGVKTAVNA